MPFPTGWPPRPASNTRSIRVFISGTTTANWGDNAYLFIDIVGANTYLPTPFSPPGSSLPIAVGTRFISGSPMGAGADPSGVQPGDTIGVQKPSIWANTVRVANRGASIVQISFGGIDSTEIGTQIHGSLIANESVTYRTRIESGIALRFPEGGSPSAFIVEAW